MGLIHSRAAKKRNKAEAEVLREEARQLRTQRTHARHEQRVEAAGDSVLRQPTVRDAIVALKRRRKD